MANTSILIKRSTTTGVPVSLDAGELAYSYTSNTIFIGTPGSNGVVNIGGQFYTSQIDNATDLATGSTIVKRDPSGNAYFNYITANVVGEIVGNANTATQLQTARNFAVSGSDITATAVSFNGTSDVTLNAALNAVPGLSAGTTGSSTSIPVLTYGANGRILAVSSASISTEFAVAGDTGSTEIAGGETFYIVGSNGLTSDVTANTVTFSTDDTVVRSNTTLTNQLINSSISVTGDFSVSGNLSILGNTTTINTTQLAVTDTLIYLGTGNYTSDLVDIGFIGHYNPGSSNAHTGIFRSAVDKTYYLFQGYQPEIDANNNIDINDASFDIATLHANLISTSATIDNLTLTNALPIASGGTNNTSFNANQLTFFNGTSVVSLANTGTAGTYGSSSYVPIVTTDGYGRVSGVSNTQIAIDTTQITSGVLTYARGGTGSSVYTDGTLIIAGVDGFASLANTTYTVTGTPAANNTVTSMTVDVYGRVTAKTYAAISGLTVGQGGTGTTSFNSAGIVYGNGTGGMLSTLAAGTSDQTWSNQILTVTNAGVPTWTTSLDGGTF